MKDLKVGVAGAGVFGTYHAQKAAASARARLVGVFDMDLSRAEKVASTYGAQGLSEFSELLDAVDAVVIAVPATYHEALAREALESGKHVLVEKPLALDGNAARGLADLAEERKLVLQVGHQERFVAQAMGVLDIPERPIRMESRRVSPPAPNGRAGDVSVIWDLMIHDLDLAACLIGRDFESVAAFGHRAHTDHIDHCVAQVLYEDAEVDLVASRDSDIRERTMKLVFPSGEIAVDFLSRQITNTTGHDVRVDISADMPDPLGAADNGFYLACLGEEKSFVPGQGAVAAVRMAQAIEDTALSRLKSK